MQMINNFLGRIDGIVWIILQILSALGTLVSILDIFKKKENEFIRIPFVVVCGGLFMLALYCRNLVEVPNIVDLYYEDACRVLTENGLRYEVKAIDKNSCVVKQSISAGQIVKKQTVVKIEVREIETSEPNDGQETMLAELREAGVPFGDLQLVYYDEEIQVLKDGEVVHYFGNEIKEFDIDSILLTNTDYGLIFNEYKIEQKDVYGEEKTIIIFEDIPSGYYELESRIRGYQPLITSGMKLSTQWQQEDASEEEHWGANIYVYNNDAKRMLPYEIMVVDQNGSKVNGVTCSLCYQSKSRIYGGYDIKDGIIPLQFHAQRGSSIIVKFDNFKNTNTDVFCEITFDDVLDGPVIVINEDGTAIQKKRTEVLEY